MDELSKQHHKTCSELVSKEKLVGNLNQELIIKEENLADIQLQCKETEKEMKLEIDALEIKCRSLEELHHEATTRLGSTERVSLIHDKECSRLFEDIENKRNKIKVLNDKVDELELIKCNHEQELNRMQSILSNKTKELSSITSNFSIEVAQERDEKMQLISKNQELRN